jgi:type II secretion system protein N
MTALAQRWRRLGSASGLATTAATAIAALAPARVALRRLVPADRTPAVLYAVYTLALFVVFLIATFPHQRLLERALAQAAGGPLVIEARGAALGLPLAYTIDALTLHVRGVEGGSAVVSATGVRATPSLLGLLRGAPYPLVVRGTLYGGHLNGTVDLREPAYALRAGLYDVDLGRYEGLGLVMDGRLAGRLAATVDVEGDTRKPTATNGQLALTVTDLALEGGKWRGLAIANLHFPELRLAGTIKNGRVELGDFAARGTEVDVSGHGTVLLQQPLAASLLNLDLTFVPTADAPDQIRLALNLLPGEAGGGGERRLRLFGTLGRPRAGR